MALTHNAVAAHYVQFDAQLTHQADFIISSLRANSSRQIEEFYRATHARAIAFARAYLKNLEDAEDAVSDAGVKLLEGETTPEHFMRTLKQIVLNRLARSKIEARLFVNLDLGFEDGSQEAL